MIQEAEEMENNRERIIRRLIDLSADLLSLAADLKAADIFTDSGQILPVNDPESEWPSGTQNAKQAHYRPNMRRISNG